MSTISNVNVCPCGKLRHEHRDHLLCLEELAEARKAAKESGYGSGTLRAVIENLTALSANARAANESAINEALERAAQVCDDHGCPDCARDVRALKSAPAPSSQTSGTTE